MRVVVIGAGIVGASAAHRLAVGGIDVTLVDNGARGAATAAGAGIIASISSRVADEATSAFRFAAARHYLELDRELRAAGIADHAYAPVGQLTVAFDETELTAVSADFAMARDLVVAHGSSSVGIPELLTGSEIARRFPLVATTSGGMFLPEVARVDGLAVREGLLAMAAGAGIRTATGTARPTIELGRVTGVGTDSGLIEADAVIVAAGAWSGSIVESVGARVQPQRGQIVHLHLPGASALPTLHTRAGHYLLTFPGDRVVIGATRETGSGFVADLTAGGIAQVLAQGVSLVPSLAGATWLEARVGLRPASSDGAPLLGRAPDAEGLYLATGMGASGLALGPYCGAVIADLVLADNGAANRHSASDTAIPPSFLPDR